MNRLIFHIDVILFNEITYASYLLALTYVINYMIK